MSLIMLLKKPSTYVFNNNIISMALLYLNSLFSISGIEPMEPSLLTLSNKSYLSQSK